MTMRLRVLKNWITALALFCAVSFPATSRAINTGDIMVADGATGLIFVDHVTGAQHVLSGGGCNDVTSTGALYRIDTGGQTFMTEKDLFHSIAGVDIYKGPSVPTGVRKSTWARVKQMYR